VQRVVVCLGGVIATFGAAAPELHSTAARADPLMSHGRCCRYSTSGTRKRTGGGYACARRCGLQERASREERDLFSKTFCLSLHR
jgi:hypothetical protein